jgi:hypothetical protein
MSKLKPIKCKGMGKPVALYALQEHSWWSLDTSFLTPCILAGLRQFRAACSDPDGQWLGGIPGDYLSEGHESFCIEDQKADFKRARKAFMHDLDLAIDAFELMDNDNEFVNSDNIVERTQRIDRGLKKFIKIYRSLWD